MTTNEIDWQAISAALLAPFDPSCVDFRPQGKASGNGKVQAVCYVDARTVADRLDEVVGAGNWSFAYEPLVIDKGQIQIAKGRLTIHGVTKEDVGEASNFDASKGCVSDALKRAAVLWGVGRYLYGISGEWVTADQYGRITESDVKRLRAKLPRPDGIAPARPAAASARREPPQTHTEASSPAEAASRPAQPQTHKNEQPATDPLALTHASAHDQHALVEALRAKGYTTQSAVSGLLLHVVGRGISAADLLREASDITLHEINRVHEFLSRVPAAGTANGKVAAK